MALLVAMTIARTFDASGAEPAVSASSLYIVATSINASVPL